MIVVAQTKPLRTILREKSNLSALPENLRVDVKVVAPDEMLLLPPNAMFDFADLCTSALWRQRADAEAAKPAVAVESEGWRCVHCGAALAANAECAKPECVSENASARRRMGVPS